MADTATVKSWIDRLKAAGLSTKFNEKLGFAQAKDGEIMAYWAIQKGRGGPWIVKCQDSPRVTWSK